MKIIDNYITLSDLATFAPNYFGDMVKGVVDIEKELIAIDAELHADLENLLLQKGSKQENLWGINFYPAENEENFIEFDSLINIRPYQNNRSRDVENKETKDKII